MTGFSRSAAVTHDFPGPLLELVADRRMTDDGSASSAAEMVRDTARAATTERPVVDGW